jgi:hypothetical protein
MGRAADGVEVVTRRHRLEEDGVEVVTGRHRPEEDGAEVVTGCHRPEEDGAEVVTGRHRPEEDGAEVVTGRHRLEEDGAEMVTGRHRREADRTDGGMARNVISLGCLTRWVASSLAVERSRAPSSPGLRPAPCCAPTISPDFAFRGAPRDDRRDHS